MSQAAPRETVPQWSQDDERQLFDTIERWVEKESAHSPEVRSR